MLDSQQDMSKYHTTSRQDTLLSHLCSLQRFVICDAFDGVLPISGFMILPWGVKQFYNSLDFSTARHVYKSNTYPSRTVYYQNLFLL